MVRKITKTGNNDSKVGIINIEDAKIGFKNFAGAESDFNKAGDRNFVIFLDPEKADELASQGWNIKEPKVSEDQTLDYTPEPYLPVSLSFTPYPPQIFTISGQDHTLLKEDEVDMLDWTRFLKADVVIRPYSWSVNGNSGIKAYLKALYVTLDTDEFAKKYGIG